MISPLFVPVRFVHKMSEPVRKMSQSMSEKYPSKSFILYKQGRKPVHLPSAPAVYSEQINYDLLPLIIAYYTLKPSTPQAHITGIDSPHPAAASN